MIEIKLIPCVICKKEYKDYLMYKYKGKKLLCNRCNAEKYRTGIIRPKIQKVSLNQEEKNYILQALKQEPLDRLRLLVHLLLINN